MVYFPASGFRSFKTGELSCIGGQMICWSSSSCSLSRTWGSSVNAFDPWLNVFSGDYRTCGFSIRCVQELTIIVKKYHFKPGVL